MRILTVVTRYRLPGLASRGGQRVPQADAGGGDGRASFWSEMKRENMYLLFNAFPLFPFQITLQKSFLFNSSH
jgi:hypothetical protein